MTKAAALTLTLDSYLGAEPDAKLHQENGAIFYEG